MANELDLLDQATYSGKSPFVLSLCTFFKIIHNISFFQNNFLIPTPCQLRLAMCSWHVRRSVAAHARFIS